MSGKVRPTRRIWLWARRDEGSRLPTVLTAAPRSKHCDKCQGCRSVHREGMYAEKEKLAKARQYKHMTFYEAAQMAKEAEVSELWLTHFSPSLTNPPGPIWGKCARFSLETYLGKDGKTKTLDFVEE